MVRGIISPPRSRSSPRENRPNNINNNNNATANPPSRPNYMSPRRRPTTPVNEPRSHRKETQPTAVKPTGLRPTKTNTDRSSTAPRADPSKPISSKPLPSRRPTATPNPNDKKFDTNNKTPAAKIRPASPRRAKPGNTPPARGPTPSKGNVKGAIGSGSRSDVSGLSLEYFDSRNGSPSPKDFRSGGSGHGQNGDVGNPNRCYSDGHYGAFSDPAVRAKLHQLSLDDKDLANLVLHANSIYESFNSDTKEEQCSSQSNNNAPRILQIYKEIASHRQGNSSITSYITKLNKLWDELVTYIDVPQCSCGSIEKPSEQMEREKVMQFVVGLHDSYSKFCTKILVMKPFPTVEKACSVIIREEKRREVVLSLEKFAAKVIENNWLVQNGNYSNVDNDGIKEQQIDHNEVASFPVEPLLIDLGSPVRC